MKTLYFDPNAKVIISLNSGNLKEGFPSITVRLKRNNQSEYEQQSGSLIADPQLYDNLFLWQKRHLVECNNLVYQQILSSSLNDLNDDDDDWEIEDKTIEIQESLKEISEQLEHHFKLWLDQSNGFQEIEYFLRQKFQEYEKISIIVETKDEIVRHLPWYSWSFLRDYPNAEIAISPISYRRIKKEADKKKDSPPRRKVRILAIFGNTGQLDFSQQETWLNNLEDAEIHFLKNKPNQPLTINEVQSHLWNNKGWDILVFSGHSKTEYHRGRIIINDLPKLEHNSLTIEQLRESLTEAIKNGLTLAIFNSCDGLGLANELENLYIPLTIVMREPIPNEVAHHFFYHFIESYAKQQQPFYQAVKQARRHLQDLEYKYPCASWLPIISQNPAIIPPTWLQLGGIPPCPYMGLKSFTENDADFYYGRQTFINTLQQTIQQQRFVNLVGASGSGKSSLVFAGLIPKLKQESQINWKTAHFRPETDPFVGLSKAIATLSNPSLNDLKTIEQEISLKNNNQSLANTLENILQASPPYTHLLLIIDQFEEVFTLVSSEDKNQFLQSIVSAVEKVPNITILTTFRADFITQLLKENILSQLLQTYQPTFLPALSRDDLREIITQPADYYSIQFEAGLVDKLINEVFNQDGRLPLLEFTLTRLWEQQEQGIITHNSYDIIGRIEKALSHYAQYEVYGKLTPEKREKVSKILPLLVNIKEENGHEILTRQLVTRKEINDWDIIEKLAYSRLVITNLAEKTNIETVELIHETLIDHWGDLKLWIQQDQEFYKWLGKFKVWLHQWESNDQKSGYLLTGKSLLEAKQWLNDRDDKLSQNQINFIKSSLRKQQKQQFILGSGIATAIALISGISVWGFQSIQEEQLFRLASESVVTPEIAIKVVPILSQRLTKAEKKVQSQQIDEALEDYRVILKVSRNVVAEIDNNSQDFQSLSSEKESLMETGETAEQQLSSVINTYRIPQLESQLKNQQFGQQLLKEVEEGQFVYDGFTDALETTYNLIMTDFGAKADIDNSGILDEGEEIVIPCQLLQQIELLWRQYTDNRCGWYGEEAAGYLSPNCQALAGKTLMTTLMYPSTIPEIEQRLRQCNIILKDD